MKLETHKRSEADSSLHEWSTAQDGLAYRTCWRQEEVKASRLQ